ncbi:MAG: hypothetical protein Q7R48_00115 [bacterium]|nr:hypothetical protein [bacterium]
MAGSERLEWMLTMLGFAAFGILLMVGGFVHHEALGVMLFIVGLGVMIAAGLWTIFEAIHYGFALGAAGLELPKVAKVPAILEEPASAS